MIDSIPLIDFFYCSANVSAILFWNILRDSQETICHLAFSLPFYTLRNHNFWKMHFTSLRFMSLNVKFWQPPQTTPNVGIVSFLKAHKLLEGIDLMYLGKSPMFDSKHHDPPTSQLKSYRGTLLLFCHLLNSVPFSHLETLNLLFPPNQNRLETDYQIQQLRILTQKHLLPALKTLQFDSTDYYSKPDKYRTQEQLQALIGLCADTLEVLRIHIDSGNQAFCSGSELAALVTNTHKLRVITLSSVVNHKKKEYMDAFTKTISSTGSCGSLQTVFLDEFRYSILDQTLTRVVQL